MKTINQENIKPTHGEDHNRDFEVEFEFGYKQLHETPLFVYADELFDGGMIKPLKVYTHSDPLLPKGKEFYKPSRTSSSIVFKSSTNFKEAVDKSSLGSRSMSPSSNKKWKLKDLLLFRSVSEGHASTRDSHGIKKRETARLVKNEGERGRKEQCSYGYERHYRGNRRAGEEIKRKTFLPYKKTLLMGCSDLDPGVYEFCKGQAVEIVC